MNIKRNMRRIIKQLNAKEIVAVPSLSGIDELLKEKTALITGGSGGIGFAIAKGFLSAGCNVIIAGTDENKLKNCCAQLESEKIRSMVIDFGDVNSFAKKIEEASRCFGNSDIDIDILVNCAGFNPKKGFFDITQDEFDRTIGINVKGTYFMCQAMAEYMIKHHIKGHILNISSSSALRPAWSPYEMSKWSIRGFTVGLADALLPYGIIVNAIAPGPTATPMLGKNANGDLDLPTSPIGRYATPVEIANLALIMVSSVGDLIVGDTLYATGGSGVISLHR